MAWKTEVYEVSDKDVTGRDVTLSGSILLKYRVTDDGGNIVEDSTWEINAQQSLAEVQAQLQSHAKVAREARARLTQVQQTLVGKKNDVPD